MGDFEWNILQAWMYRCGPARFVLLTARARFCVSEIAREAAARASSSNAWLTLAQSGDFHCPAFMQS